jgi:hypothetical protein
MASRERSTRGSCQIAQATATTAVATIGDRSQSSPASKKPRHPISSPMTIKNSKSAIGSTGTGIESGLFPAMTDAMWPRA